MMDVSIGTLGSTIGSPFNRWRRRRMMSMIGSAAKFGLASQALKLGARGITAKPGWTARAISWRVLGSPLWPWEQRRVRRRFGGMLLGRSTQFGRLGRRRQRKLEAWQMAAALALGGCLMYFFDPEMGHRRRTMAMQRAGRLLRQSIRGLGRTGRKMGADLSGKRQALAHVRDAHEPLDDATLAHKVESILFRDPRVPKGRINVNAENGVVFLRGELEHDGELREVERAVRHIEGVMEVRSLLHVTGR